LGARTGGVLKTIPILLGCISFPGREVTVMLMHCLNCEEIIHNHAVIPLVFVKKSQSSWPPVELSDDKFFILCPHCMKRNYFIKEYTVAGVGLRLSHLEH
jgi:hypothetical protein